MRKKPILIALAAIGLSGAAHAQYPVSPQEVILPVTISGSPVGRFTIIAPPLVKRNVAYFEATAISGTIVTSSSSSFGDFTTLPHSLMLLSGTSRGFAVPIVANSATSVTISSTMPGPPPVGSEFVVVEDYTLNNLIGSGTAGSGAAKELPVSWATGASFSTAFTDKIVKPNPITQSLSEVFFFYTGSGGPGWRTNADLVTDRGNERIPIGTGVLAQRANFFTSSLILDITGELRVGNRLTQVKGAVSGVGNTIVANTNPSPTTLGAFGLFESGLIGGAAFSVAFTDRVLLPTGSGGALETYFYNTALNIFNKTTTGTANQNSVVIPAGSGALIQRATLTGTATFQHRTQQLFTP